TAVTPFLRAGVAGDPARKKPYVVYGADVLFERTIALAPGAPQYEHRFLVADARAGFLAHRGTRRDAGAFSYYFVRSGLSYDVPVLVDFWDARQRRRAKLTLGVENYFGAGRPLDRLVFAALSVRRETAREGLLIRKLDLSAGSDLKGRYRMTLGFGHGF